VKVFPSLATRPLHITGGMCPWRPIPYRIFTSILLESYAGTYIPYIVKAILSASNPPVKLVKFAIGDGTIGDDLVFENAPVVSDALKWFQPS
jgi:carboxypeptidase D